MASSRDIVRRIKSIKNTKKVTKAMEMVSSSKMRRAVNSVLATRFYSTHAWQLILNVAGKTRSELHPLLISRKAEKKIGIVAVSSNRGLCGSFNQQVVKAAVDYIKKLQKENPKLEVEVISVGKKSSKTFLRLGYNVVAEFSKNDVVERADEIRPLAKMVVNDYLAGKYDRVVLFYTDFVSTLKQAPRQKQILPIEREPDEILGTIGEVKKLEIRNQKSEIEEESARGGSGSAEKFEYLFEPSPKTILNELLPRLLEMQVYQAMLESNASEHSARMMAMRNASDAAGDMIDELTLSYNQARQAAITKEIAEIAGGKAALE